MGRFDVVLTAVITGPLVAGNAVDIATRVSQSCVDRQSNLVMSASRLRDGGTLLRMAGTSVEQVGDALRAHLAFLAPLTGGDLWRRKW